MPKEKRRRVRRKRARLVLMEYLVLVKAGGRWRPLWAGDEL